MKFYTLYHKELGHYIGRGAFSKDQPDSAKTYSDIGHIKSAYTLLTKSWSWARGYEYADLHWQNFIVIEFESSCKAKFNLGDLL